ncbi:MAG: hypothetical protein JSS43_16640 [Proteobacteria bacterium]|nr:hypothetical protein [Pseudomonadota bacterium]
MKFLWALLFSLLFTALLAVVYLIHVWFLPVRVIFYSAILDGVVAAVATATILLALRRRLPFTGFESVLLLTIWLLGGYAFAISGPTVLDRSLSFYILEKLAQRGGGIRADAFPMVFKEEYLPEFRLVDVRLTEQTQSGTVEIVDGCVRLTPWGWKLVGISSFIRAHLLARHRLLAGVYTDTLTTPFANSAKGQQGYECR